MLEDYSVITAPTEYGLLLNRQQVVPHSLCVSFDAHWSGGGVPRVQPASENGAMRQALPPQGGASYEGMCVRMKTMMMMIMIVVRKMKVATKTCEKTFLSLLIIMAK